jgi:hypothetical protein
MIRAVIEPTTPVIKQMIVYTKNAVSWEFTPWDSRMNQRLGGTYRLHQQGEKNRRAGNNVSSTKQPKHAANKYVGSCKSHMAYNPRRHHSS